MLRHQLVTDRISRIPGLSLFYQSVGLSVCLCLPLCQSAGLSRSLSVSSSVSLSLCLSLSSIRRGCCSVSQSLSGYLPFCLSLYAVSVPVSVSCLSPSLPCAHPSCPSLLLLLLMARQAALQATRGVSRDVASSLRGAFHSAAAAAATGVSAWKVPEPALGPDGQPLHQQQQQQQQQQEEDVKRSPSMASSISSAATLFSSLLHRGAQGQGDSAAAAAAAAEQSLPADNHCVKPERCGQHPNAAAAAAASGGETGPSPSGSPRGETTCFPEGSRSDSLQSLFAEKLQQARRSSSLRFASLSSSLKGLSLRPAVSKHQQHQQNDACPVVRYKQDQKHPNAAAAAAAAEPANVVATQQQRQQETEIKGDRSAVDVCGFSHQQQVFCCCCCCMQGDRDIFAACTRVWHRLLCCTSLMYVSPAAAAAAAGCGAVGICNRRHRR